MPEYVDGFVIPLPVDKKEKYLEIASIAGQVWMEHGALSYRECIAEDLKNEWGVPFSALAGVKEGETVLFSWIVFKSREHRDEVNAKVMADPRIKCGMEGQEPPFDCKRMAYGGFESLVSF